jgi:hypothetical protein
MGKPELEAFESVKDQIGYCGIWCGSCAVGNGSLSQLTTRYEEVLRSHGLQHWAPKDLDYEGLTRNLAVVNRIASCPGCLQGGGRENCELRACARGRDLEDCLACGERGQCRHGQVLEHMRSGARAAGLLVKDQGDSNQSILGRWQAELKSKWPTLVLFVGED